MSERVQMARLTTVGGSFAARVLQARLTAEGIGVELRGAIDGPYQFTVGGLSQVDVYVSPADLEDARLILLADEIDSILVDGPEDEEPSAPARVAGSLIAARHVFWLVIAALVLSGLSPILHLALTD